MSLDSDIRQLGSVPIFERLEFEARRLLAFSAETKILRAGDVLFRRGETSDGGYFVLKGSIALDYSEGIGRAVTIVGANRLIGERALLTETLRPATAIAREPTQALKISRHLFLRVLNEYPQAAEAIRRAIAAKLSEFVDELRRGPTGQP